MAAAPGAVPVDRVPGPGPTIGGAVRAAIGNAWYHSWRLVPANLVWSVVALLIGAAAILAPPAILLVPLLALPTAGMFRLAGRIVRGDAVAFSDATDAWRSDVRATLATGAGLALATAILAVNLLTGLGSGTPLGWAIATLAGWGLVGLWLFAWVAWPILADPRRAGRPAVARLRLAALLLLAHPARIGALGLVLGVFLVVSAVALVALVTVSVSLAALVAAELVLPAADRLEVRLGAVEPTVAGAADVA